MVYTVEGLTLGYGVEVEGTKVGLVLEECVSKYERGGKV